MSIWTKTPNKSLLKPIKDKEGEFHKYTAKDRKYTIAAITVTMSKFGPSGSLKSANIILEHAMAVIAKINREAFFDLKYMW